MSTRGRQLCVPSNSNFEINEFMQKLILKGSGLACMIFCWIMPYIYCQTETWGLYTRIIRRFRFYQHSISLPWRDCNQLGSVPQHYHQDKNHCDSLTALWLTEIVQIVLLWLHSMCHPDTEQRLMLGGCTEPEPGPSEGSLTQRDRHLQPGLHEGEAAQTETRW